MHVSFRYQRKETEMEKGRKPDSGSSTRKFTLNNFQTMLPFFLKHCGHRHYAKAASSLADILN
jgi:hypothetical protein